MRFSLVSTSLVGSRYHILSNTLYDSSETRYILNIVVDSIYEDFVISPPNFPADTMLNTLKQQLSYIKRSKINGYGDIYKLLWNSQEERVKENYKL